MKKYNEDNQPELGGYYNRWVIASTGVKETTCGMPGYAQGSMSETARKMLRMGVIVELEPGQVLTTKAEGQSWVFLVLEGVLELILSRENGDELSLAHRCNGDLVGELGVLSLGTGNVRICAQNKVRCVRVTREDFMRLLDNSAASMRVLYVHLARSLFDMTEKLESLVFENVQQRVYRQLFGLCSSPISSYHKDGMLVIATRSHLARAIGCSREAAGRALGVLQRNGYVVVSGSRILMLGKVAPATQRPKMAAV